MTTTDTIIIDKAIEALDQARSALVALRAGGAGLGHVPINGIERSR
ncbi:hypothetical protein [Borborobacter arsenicus]|nr:hypothetical protein [Pseudaminobacter arsenicus]